MDYGASSYRRFLDGDDEGLAEIVRIYKDGLILYINSYVNNLYIAEELMEETFFKIIIKKPKFSPRHTFKTWLYIISRNVTIDYLRRNTKRNCISINDIDNYLKDEFNLEKSYISNEQNLIVHNALKKLNSDYRQILWLIYFEDFTNSEVSVIMKKNSRQIVNLLYRAKSALKSQLDKEGFIYEEL